MPAAPAVISEPENFSRLAWEMPAGAVSFDGGWNFGSQLYDAATVEPDGSRVHVQLVVCDACLRDAVSRGLAREVRDYAPPRDSTGMRVVLADVGQGETLLGALVDDLKRALVRFGPNYRVSVAVENEDESDFPKKVEVLFNCTVAKGETS